MTAITDLASASSVAAGNYLVVSQAGTDRKADASLWAIRSIDNAFDGTISFGANGSAPSVGVASIRRSASGGLMFTGYAGAVAAFAFQNSAAADVMYCPVGTNTMLFASLAGSGTRSVYSTSTGVLTNTSSDERLKQDIEPIEAEEALALVSALEPVRYNWIDGAARGEQREIGLIAQQVAPHVPEIIGANVDGTLSLDYPKLTALLIGAVQELTARVASLEAQLAK